MSAIRPTTRRWLLGMALAATLGTCAWLASQPAQDEVPSAGLAIALPRERPSPAASVTPHALPTRPRLADAPLRAASHWMQPSPPVVAPAVVASISAVTAAAPPPLRLRYLGQLQDGDRRLAMLVGAQGRTQMLAVGEQIEGQWRIERITDTTLELRWLRGDAVQHLRLGS